MLRSLKNLKNIRDKEGITLIALVVTIIILLILAGVTISLLLGENGIIEKARQTQAAGRYGIITDKIYEREANLEISKRMGEDGEYEEDNPAFIERLIREGLIKEGEDDYDDESYTTIYLGLQKDGSYLYTINLLDFTSNNPNKNMALIIRTTLPNEKVNLPISNMTGLTINWDFLNGGEFEEAQLELIDEPSAGQKNYPVHVYPIAGEYEVQIKGNSAPDASFGYISSGTVNKNLVGLKAWGENGFMYFGQQFGKNIEGNIPSPTKNTFINTIWISALFMECDKITGTIPANLFPKCPNLEVIDEVFEGCTGLTGTISPNIFANCPKIEQIMGIFSGCENLTGTIPPNIFANCPKIEQIMGIFSGCENLTGTIPPNMFSNCPNLEYVDSVFSGCQNLTGTIPANLFANNSNIISFGYTFYYCTGLTGNAPDLWNQYSDAINARMCFGDCINLDNYDQIPDEWK